MAYPPLASRTLVQDAGRLTCRSRPSARCEHAHPSATSTSLPSLAPAHDNNVQTTAARDTVNAGPQSGEAGEPSYPRLPAQHRLEEETVTNFLLGSDLVKIRPAQALNPTTCLFREAARR
jgi:hypothetical protein